MGISVKTNTRYEKIQSKRFLCNRCLAWMIEWVPVVGKGMMAGWKKHVMEDCGGKVPQVWLQCPNGHPFGVHGFRDIHDKSGMAHRRQPGQLRNLGPPRPKPTWRTK